MYKPVLFLITFLFATFGVWAQSTYQMSSALDFYRSHKMSTGEYMKGLTADDIEGSPYLNDEFVEGTLYTTAKQQFVDVRLRYNIYNQNLEFKNNEDQVMEVASPEVIERASFDGIEMVYIPYAISKKIRRAFFKVLVEGNISLYAQPQLLYKQAEQPKAYAEAVPARFIQKPDLYFFRNGKNEAILVDKKNELIEFFPAHNKEIEAFIKKNKIKMNKPEDLIEVVNYYNSNF